MNVPFDYKSFLTTVSNHPGVYRMYNADGIVIYVGKAKNLKKRLSSYFQQKITSRKIEVLVGLIADIDITITHSETEALLLEHNYIKFYQPRYNVLLRDDKSYPFIFLSADAYPRLAMHRGSKKLKGEYFGPFPSGYIVRATLAMLQKIFPIRQCENSVYRNRSRPCLQYQIGRCLAPCIEGLISEQEYEQQVKHVRLFLSGKNDRVLLKLISDMEKESSALNFEEAERIRCKIKAIREVMKKQYVSTNGEDLDIIGVAMDKQIVCMHALFVRQGRVIGSRSFFPKTPNGTTFTEIVESFFNQFYLQSNQMYSLPDKILLDYHLKDKTILTDFLSKLAGHRVNIQVKPRGDHARYLNLARMNAISALRRKLFQHLTIQENINALAMFLNISKVKRIECFDISHMSGEQTVAACVVFDVNGPLRSEYRSYNIINIKPGDDYGAMNQVLRRRYSKVVEFSKVPDIVLIDGGKGHLRQAKMVFAELNVPWDKHHPVLIGVAKNINRKKGFETLFLDEEGEGLRLSMDSPVLRIVQYIRDESHNHAISVHRKKLLTEKNSSSLEIIKGVGPKRRQALLKHMGGLQGLRDASIEEILKVPGISKGIAERIYYALKC